MMGYDDIQSGSLIEYQFLWHREGLRGGTKRTDWPIEQEFW